MKGVKAVYETTFSGPIRVRVLAIYSTYNDQILEVVARVTSRTNRSYTVGELVVVQPLYLWSKASYRGRFKCQTLYEGRPELSGLPWVDAKTKVQLTGQGVNWAYLSSNKVRDNYYTTQP